MAYRCPFGYEVAAHVSVFQRSMHNRQRSQRLVTQHFKNRSLNIRQSINIENASPSYNASTAYFELTHTCSKNIAKIAPIYAPGYFKGAGRQKCCTQIFIIPSRHTTWTLLVRLFPLDPKLFAKLCVIFLEFLFSHIFGAPQFLDLTYKAPPSLHHLAKFPTILGHPNFWILLIKLHLVYIIWQSFAAIGRGARRFCP